MNCSREFHRLPIFAIKVKTAYGMGRPSFSLTQKP